MADKLTSPEDEYFAKEELEKLKAIREQRDQKRASVAADQKRMEHWMKCPKCGGDLKETISRDIAIDICQSCHGVWLDEGELETLLGARESTLKRIMQSVRETMRFGGGIHDGPGDLAK